MDTYFDEVAECLKNMSRHSLDAAAMNLISAAKSHHKNVFTVGNGGSAATASHFANDLTKMAGIRAFCINDMTPTVLAYGNDEGWHNMFASAIKNLASAGDVLIAFSCSGESPNIIAAIHEAKARGIVTIGITGDKDNSLLREAMVGIRVPHSDIRVQEDVHLVICHDLTGQLRSIS